MKSWINRQTGGRGQVSDTEAQSEEGRSKT